MSASTAHPHLRARIGARPLDCGETTVLSSPSGRTSERELTLVPKPFADSLEKHFPALARQISPDSNRRAASMGALNSSKPVFASPYASRGRLPTSRKAGLLLPRRLSTRAVRCGITLGSLHSIQRIPLPESREGSRQEVTLTDSPP